MSKVTANYGTAIDVEEGDGKFFINSNAVQPDIVSLGEGRFHVLYNGISYSVSADSIDRESKTCILNLNGKKVQITLKDAHDELLERMGLGGDAAKKLNEFKAPMPGMVLRVLVKVGDTVKKGDGMLVLEAMKMENILKSTGDGTVKNILVSEKDKVEKGQVLISFQ